MLKPNKQRHDYGSRLQLLVRFKVYLSRDLDDARDGSIYTYQLGIFEVQSDGRPFKLRK
jgi:hypothetical protein